MERMTTLNVRERTAKRFRRCGVYGDSADSILNKIISVYEKDIPSLKRDEVKGYS